MISELHRRTLTELFDGALGEVIEEITFCLRSGMTPQPSNIPSMSTSDNGMPSISNSTPFDRNGPLEYSALLNPPWGDDAARLIGSFPAERFPMLTKLKEYASSEADIASRVLPGTSENGALIHTAIELWMKYAADAFFRKFGPTAVSTPMRRETVLRPVLAGLIDDALGIAVIVPVALVHFDFYRFRIADNAYFIRMQPCLQRARWSGKAYGANGHDAVLAAATHALVITGLSIKNGAKTALAQDLSRPDHDVREMVDSFFAALRLDLGIETGYAQEVRLARGWRAFGRPDLPEVFAVGARRYPQHFDDFGWTAVDLPRVSKDQMASVVAIWLQLRELCDQKLDIALRRLNSAMVREEAADALLDATIALEVLLGDGDGQAISWKLRMRAAALAGIGNNQRASSEMFANIKQTYDARSAIVHGGKARKGAASDVAVAAVAVNALRSVIKLLLANPQYLDPIKIDSDLLLSVYDPTR